MILKYENLLKELDQYPNLKGAVEHFYNTDGQPEHEGKLPNLIVWIRQVLENESDDAPEYFEMSERQTEDFYSWGHNSRWSNTFWVFLENHFNWCVALCIDLAREYGDYDIEKYMNETTEN